MAPPGSCGQVVEVLAPLLRDAFEDALRASIGCVLEPLVDALALEPQHVVELLLDVFEDVVEAVPLELLLTLFAQAFHQLLKSGELPPVAVAPALAQQAAQRSLEIPAMEHVLAQPVEERIGVVAEWVLRAVPDAEAVLPRNRTDARGRDLDVPVCTESSSDACAIDESAPSIEGIGSGYRRYPP